MSDIKKSAEISPDGMYRYSLERTRCEIWTRVMGYHRPISSFNIGKQGEVAERKYFDEKKCCCRK